MDPPQLPYVKVAKFNAAQVGDSSTKNVLGGQDILGSFQNAGKYHGHRTPVLGVVNHLLRGSFKHRDPFYDFKEAVEFSVIFLEQNGITPQA